MSFIYPSHGTFTPDQTWHGPDMNPVWSAGSRACAVCSWTLACRSKLGTGPPWWPWCHANPTYSLGTWVWVKIEYPNSWMVNTKNRLKSVVPQVLHFDSYPHAHASTLSLIFIETSACLDGILTYSDHIEHVQHNKSSVCLYDPACLYVALSCASA